MGRPLKNPDRKRPCTDKELAFCASYAAHGNKSQAFRDAGYSCGNMDATAIASNAQSIFLRKCVQEEISRLLAAKEQARAEAYKEEFAAQLAQWTRDDSLNALREIVGKAMEAVRAPICGEDGEIVGYKFDSAAARVVRDAVESLNKMQGYNEPEKSEVDAVISVAFADGGDFTG